MFQTCKQLFKVNYIFIFKLILPTHAFLNGTNQVYWKLYCLVIKFQKNSTRSKFMYLQVCEVVFAITGKILFRISGIIFFKVITNFPHMDLCGQFYYFYLLHSYPVVLPNEDLSN